MKALIQIVKLEEYKKSGDDYRRGELKGKVKLKRTFTPSAVKQLKTTGKRRSSAPKRIKKEVEKEREISKTGTVAERHNNPANIKYTSTFVGALQKEGISVNKGQEATDGGNFILFNNPEDGKFAHGILLRGSGYRNLTVDKAMRRWSNNGYGAEVSSIDPDETIGSLSDSELSTLMDDMRTREGWLDLEKTYPDKTTQINEARKEGWTDEEINSFLKS